MELSDSTTTLAGILLLSLVTVESGGALLFRIAIGRHEATTAQRDFFRAGHAHAGVFLILGLVCQVFVDATTLSGLAEWIARSFVPIAALLLPAGFFLSMTRPGTTAPNRLIVLVPVGAGLLTIGLITLGIGLLTA